MNPDMDAEPPPRSDRRAAGASASADAAPGTSTARSSSASAAARSHYGSAPRAEGRRHGHLPQPRDGLHRPVRLRQETFLRCFNRMNDLIPTARRSSGDVHYHGEDLYGPGRRPGRGAQAHRHGVPEAEPVPEVDLREHRVRPARARHEGQTWTSASSAPAARRALGRGQGPAEGAARCRLSGGQQQRLCIARCAGDRSRGAADGRAVLGARSDRHREDRGADGRAEEGVHDRHRHPQHAAGRPRRRHDRLLLASRSARRAAGRACSWSTTRRRACSRTPPTRAPRPTSQGGSDEAGIRRRTGHARGRAAGGRHRHRAGHPRRAGGAAGLGAGRARLPGRPRRPRRRAVPADRARRRDADRAPGARSRPTCGSCSACCRRTPTSSG